MSDLAARRANVRETITAARREPELAALWVKCLRLAIYDYRCAQSGEM